MSPPADSSGSVRHDCLLPRNLFCRLVCPWSSTKGNLFALLAGLVYRRPTLCHHHIPPSLACTHQHLSPVKSHHTATDQCATWPPIRLTLSQIASCARVALNLRPAKTSFSTAHSTPPCLPLSFPPYDSRTLSLF